MKTTKPGGVIAWLRSPSRTVVLTLVALLGAGLAAAVWPTVAALIWKVAVVDLDETLIQAGIVSLWGVAVALGRMVWRRGRAEGRWRTAGTLALLMLAAASGLVIGLIVAAPYLDDRWGNVFAYINSSAFYGVLPKADPMQLFLGGAIATSGLFIASALAWRCGARVRHGVAVLALVLPVFVYLARDDAEWRDPIELAEFAPPGADAVVASEIFIRYATGTEKARAFAEPELFASNRYPKINAAGWVDFVAENRGEVAEIWAEMLPVRTWWAEWNRYPAVADPTNSIISPNPSYQVIRGYARAACAEATARALEGRGDEAIELLLPLIEGAGKMQAHSVVLVRTMIAIVLRGMAVDTAVVIIDRSEISATARERLRAALASTVTGEDGARRLVAGEFAIQLGQFRRMEQARANGELGWLAGSVSAVFFNPRRTYNEISELVAEMSERAARRDDVGVGAITLNYFESVRKRPGIKNPGGRWWVHLTLPSYGKVVGNFWKTEDATVALIARLEQSAPVTSAKAVQP